MLKRRGVQHLRKPTISPAWVACALVVASTGLMLVAGWVSVYQQVARERNVAVEAALGESRNRAIALELYVARTIEGADLVTRHIAEAYLSSGRLRRRSSGPIVPVLIRDSIVGGGTYQVVSVVSPEGDLLATSEQRGARPSNVSRNPVFTSLAADPGTDLLISPPVESKILGDTFIYLARRVLGEDGATLGFVAVQIRPRDLSHFVDSVRFRPTDLISVIGLDGITRVRREGDRVSFGDDQRGLLVMRMQERNPNGSYLGPSTRDGHVRYFSHRRLAGYPIFVTAGVSQSAALEPVLRRAWLYRGVMGVLTLVSMLLAAFILIGIRRRHARERDLADANARLREAQRIAKIGDWECDLETGTILWSEELCTMYERDPRSGRLHLHDLFAYLDDNGRSQVARVIASALSTGEPQTYEFRAHLPSGVTSDRRLTAIPIKSESGIVTRLVGTDQDVTSDKLLASLQEQINHLSRTDAMNMMAATLAHELTQPLTAASNYLSGGANWLAKSDESARKMARDALVAARDQVQIAGNIIRGVRDMVRSERRAGELVDIRNLLEDSVRSLVSSQTCLEEWVHYDVAEGAETFLGDRVQIQQVLMNLIRNACEAAAAVDTPAVHVRACLLDAQCVQFTVADNGLGMGGSHDDLFSPFGSTKETGLGLGLSISRTIVEYHGGRIWLDSTGSSGTAISFTVPARAGDGR